MFKKIGGMISRSFDIADGTSFEFGDARIRFSEPVIHGSNDSGLGWILMLTIEVWNTRILFTSDVKGPMVSPTLNRILDENPQLVIVGGPPTYLSGLKVADKQLERGIVNLKKLVQRVPITILEHHL